MSEHPGRIAAVTVGVPVYNGAAFLADSLECLRLQTFTDIEVLILDNASTDDTPTIIADFVARDPRFRCVRQSQNMGALRNFRDALELAESPFFMWRAADDLSDLNYIEVLHGLLVANPVKMLAVGRVVNLFRGAVVREFRLPPLRGDGGLRDQHELLFKSHPAWIYGLFRTEAARPAVYKALDGHGDYTRAWDNLALIPFMLDATLVGSDETRFQFVLREGPVKFGDRRPPRKDPPFNEMLALRRRFIKVGREFVAERFQGVRRIAGEWMLWRYANKNAYKLKNIARRTLRGWVGLRP